MRFTAQELTCDHGCRFLPHPGQIGRVTKALVTDQIPVNAIPVEGCWNRSIITWYMCRHTISDNVLSVFVQPPNYYSGNMFKFYHVTLAFLSLRLKQGSLDCCGTPTCGMQVWLQNSTAIPRLALGSCLWYRVLGMWLLVGNANMAMLDT